MAGQPERRSFRNQLIACDPVDDKILFGSAGDINKLAIGADGDGLDKFAGGDRLGSWTIDARDCGKNTRNFWPKKCMLWRGQRSQCMSMAHPLSWHGNADSQHQTRHDISL